jgi:acetyl-CoA carboxylase biotin carboxylase subunit
MFNKVLVANRGEIAIRVMRALGEMGIRAVAVYSEADRQAHHLRFADEAYPIGPAESTKSYLNVERILDTARRSGCQAVHPGYGFLAENAGFAAACADLGVTFIGPPPDAIEAMGSKTAARKKMMSAGVPVIPGHDAPLASEEEAMAVARGLGYPILLKAVAGGGGKGMRVVRNDGEVPSALRATRGEALSAFGSAEIYMEKYITEPRHVEIQVLAGRTIHLGERECSIQRRYQKLIEESPSVAVDSDLRRRMGETAVRAAEAVGYRNAGTVEFILGPGGQFHFLEMNTRLQVEHPVTEMVTGVDLVKEQIRIAAGEPLSILQENIAPAGWAIECRIYAEDPAGQFMPSVGTIRRLQTPEGPGVRVDSGVTQGSEVSLYYDPMISKLVAWGRDRAEAIDRMSRALDEYRISGVRTTIPFHRWVMGHPRFRSGRFHTGFIDESFSPEEALALSEEDRRAAVIAAALAWHASQFPKSRERSARTGSAWKIAGRCHLQGRRAGRL